MDKETEIFFNCRLTGCAAEMVLQKMKEKKDAGTYHFGKQRAVQTLLCELWQKREGFKSAPSTQASRE